MDCKVLFTDDSVCCGAAQSAVDQATSRGVLFVASAGNEGVDTDSTPHYPSSLPDDIVLAVAATDRTGALWCASSGETYMCASVHVRSILVIVCMGIALYCWWLFHVMPCTTASPYQISRK